MCALKINSSSTNLRILNTTHFTATTTTSAFLENSAVSPSHLGALVGIIAHDKTEQQPGHHDVAQPEHAEVPRVVRRGEDQLAGQREPRRVPRHVAAQVELPRHRAHRIVGGTGGHLDHDVGAEDVLREEDPEDVVEEQAGEQERADLQAGQPDESDEGHAEAHAHGVHEEPVTWKDAKGQRSKVKVMF